MSDDLERDATLEAAWRRARTCERCPSLVASRTQVVVGAGPAAADVLIVGDAPTAGEDELGLPLVGQAARLLDRVLGEVGLPRADVFLTTLVKCRPPGNRDPSPAEVASCSEHLLAQVEAVRPRVVLALGGVATKLLRGSPEPIRERRGREEPLRLGTVPLWLLPTFHPSAALYAPALVELLRADVRRLPELVARGRPEVAAPPEPVVAAEAPPVTAPGQLGLF